MGQKAEEQSCGRSAQLRSAVSWAPLCSISNKLLVRAVSMGCSSIPYDLYRILNMGETPSPPPPPISRYGPIELGWAPTHTCYWCSPKARRSCRVVALLGQGCLGSSPPRSSTAADLNNSVFQQHRAAWWCMSSDSPRGDNQCAPPGSPVRCAAIASKSPSRAEPAAGVSQSRPIASTTYTRSALATTVARCQLRRRAPAARSAGPWKSSRASARASSCSSGSGWVEAQRIGGGG